MNNRLCCFWVIIAWITILVHCKWVLEYLILLKFPLQIIKYHFLGKVLHSFASLCVSITLDIHYANMQLGKSTKQCEYFILPLQFSFELPCFLFISAIGTHISLARSLGPDPKTCQIRKRVFELFKSVAKIVLFVNL